MFEEKAAGFPQRTNSQLNTDFCISPINLQLQTAEESYLGTRVVNTLPK